MIWGTGGWWVGGGWYSLYVHIIILFERANKICYIQNAKHATMTDVILIIDVTIELRYVGPACAEECDVMWLVPNRTVPHSIEIIYLIVDSRYTATFSTDFNALLTLR